MTNKMQPKVNLISLFPTMSTCQAGDSFDLKNTSKEEVTVYRLNGMDLVDGDKYKVIHDHQKKTITIKNKNDK
jgi:sortase (surface protein transpeptidase)